MDVFASLKVIIPIVVNRSVIRLVVSTLGNLILDCLNFAFLEHQGSRSTGRGVR